MLVWFLIVINVFPLLITSYPPITLKKRILISLVAVARKAHNKQDVISSSTSQGSSINARAAPNVDSWLDQIKNNAAHRTSFLCAAICYWFIVIVIATVITCVHIVPYTMNAPNHISLSLSQHATTTFKHNKAMLINKCVYNVYMLRDV